MGLKASGAVDDSRVVMSDLVQAKWKGGYPVDVQGQGIIEPGGLAMIPKAEAQASDHWEPTRRTTPIEPTTEDDA